MKCNKRYVVSGLLALIAGAFVFQPLGLAEEKVVIGAIWPLTEALAEIGQLNKKGIELALDIINNEYPDLNLPLAESAGLPNLGGAKIEVIWGDSRGIPEQGRSVAEHLISEKHVVALMGCYQSSVTETASLPAEKYGIPFLNPDSASPWLTERGFKYFWRTSAIVSTWTEDVFKYADDVNERYGTNLHTVAIAHEDSLWGTEGADWMAYWADKYNYEVVERVKYPTGTVDLSLEALRIKAKDPDILMMLGYISDNILMIQTLKEYNWLPKIYMSGEMIQVPAFLNALGEAGNYCSLIIQFPPDLVKGKEVTRKVDEMLYERYGEHLTDTIARAIMGVFVLADAINRAGSTDPEAINAALAETNIPGEQILLPWDAIRFDEKHQLVGGHYSVMQIIDLEYCTVWPWEIAVAEPVVPMPGWNER